MDINSIADHIEANLIRLPKGICTVSYLGGYIEALSDTNQITEKERDLLYKEYVRKYPESGQ